jgi:hypothetical protein
MIPQRMLGNEFSHSGIRNRVTACRKRLRESRVMVKANAAAEFEKLFSADAPSSCRLTELAANDDRDSVPPEVGIT